MKAENGKKVKVEFVGRLENGAVFGEAPPEKPVEFTVGEGQIIPGFVEAVRGMEPGEEKTVRVAPEEGFGGYDPEKVIRFNRAHFANREPITEGMEILEKDKSGQEFVGRVDSLSEEAVALNLNHPLAGQTLEFDIRLQAVA